jgi:hypothetical protein
VGDFLAQFHLQEISLRNLKDQIDLNSKMTRDLKILIQHPVLKIHNRRIKQKKKFVKSKDYIKLQIFCIGSQVLKSSFSYVFLEYIYGINPVLAALSA